MSGTGTGVRGDEGPGFKLTVESLVEERAGELFVTVIGFWGVGGVGFCGTGCFGFASGVVLRVLVLGS